MSLRHAQTDLARIIQSRRALTLAAHFVPAGLGSQVLFWSGDALFTAATMSTTALLAAPWPFQNASKAACRHQPPHAQYGARRRRGPEASRATALCCKLRSSPRTSYFGMPRPSSASPSTRRSRLTTFPAQGRLCKPSDSPLSSTSRWASKQCTPRTRSTSASAPDEARCRSSLRRRGSRREFASTALAHAFDRRAAAVAASDAIGSCSGRQDDGISSGSGSGTAATPLPCSSAPADSDDDESGSDEGVVASTCAIATGSLVPGMSIHHFSVCLPRSASRGAVSRVLGLVPWRLRDTFRLGGCV